MPQRLRIPTHYYLYSDPPDKDGHEMLHFVSGHKRVRLRGHSFREFVQVVAPLLDGKHTVEQIEEEVADLFKPEDLRACLEMLGTHGLLEDAELSPVAPVVEEFLRPQMNVFHELSTDPEQSLMRLMQAKVAIFGLHGLGASCALGLAGSGVGSLVCVDAGKVSATDAYFSPAYRATDGGLSRVDVVGQRIEAISKHTKYIPYVNELESDEDVRRIVEGCDFVRNCLDEGQISLAYKLNRVCLSLGVRFTTIQASGVEVTLGPTVEPKHTACFMCYKMRSVACADNPEAEFAFQGFLDRRRQDDSHRHANLSFGVNIAAQLAGVETLKVLTGLPGTSARGRIHVLNLLDMSMQTHLVLRKPWCPACLVSWEDKNAL
jgi:molybdopterin-synthase adenylyltransferase